MFQKNCEKLRIEYSNAGFCGEGNQKRKKRRDCIRNGQIIIIRSKNVDLERERERVNKEDKKEQKKIRLRVRY